MAQRIVVDPVTRIEGHLRIEAEIKDGKIVDAFSSSTMVRGLENGPNDGRPLYRGVRTKRYTYLRSDKHGEWLLFDNKKDPYQTKNVINDPAYARVKQYLSAELDGWLERFDDKFPEPPVAPEVPESQRSRERGEERQGRPAR